MKFLSGRSQDFLATSLNHPAFGAELLRSLPAESVKALVDLGAHVGMWSLMARILHPQARILAVEPYGPIYECLVDNANGLRIDTLQAGLGNGRPYGIAEISNDLSTSFREVPAGDTDTVPSRRLAGFLDLLGGLRSDWVDRTCWKIDVEGAESILLGDQQSIEILQQSIGFVIDIHAGWKRGWQQWAGLFATSHELHAHRSNHDTGVLLGSRVKRDTNVTYHDFDKEHVVRVQSIAQWPVIPPLQSTEAA